MVGTGTIMTHESGEDFVVEWQIEHFSTLRKNNGAYYDSPTFSYHYGQRWCLRIYPNGSHSFGHVDLGLFKCTFYYSIKLPFSLSLKTAKGEKYKEEHVTKDFDDYNRFHEFIPFLSRSELIRLRSDLLPDDVLTVVCTMKEWKWTPAGSDIGNVPERANVGESSQRARASTQSARPSTQTVEASTQTVEEKRDAGAAGFTIGPHEDELRRDFKQLFLSKEDCDVIIKVKDSEFTAHRAILKARSPMFASTFRHDMKENATGIVEIDDCDPSVFSDFLCYLYCGDATLILQENVFGLFTAADKYQVSNLRAKCLEFMKNNLSVDTFCETLTLALKHSEAELIRLCTDYFKQNVPKIIVTVKWQIFLAENPTESNKLLIKYFVPNCS